MVMAVPGWENASREQAQALVYQLLEQLITAGLASPPAKQRT